MQSDRLLSSLECLLPLLAVMPILRLVLLVGWGLGLGRVGLELFARFQPCCSDRYHAAVFIAAHILVNSRNG